MIHLDANFLIDTLKPNSAQSLALEKWLRDGEPLAMSAIAWSEFLCGPLDEAAASSAKGLLETIEPFLDSDAELAAKLFNETGRRPRAHADCMIAAVAIRLTAALATSNHADFKRFEKSGLRIAEL